MITRTWYTRPHEVSHAPEYLAPAFAFPLNTSARGTGWLREVCIKPRRVPKGHGMLHRRTSREETKRHGMPGAHLLHGRSKEWEIIA